MRYRKKRVNAPKKRALANIRAEAAISRPRQESDHRSLRSNSPHKARVGATGVSGEVLKAFGLDALFSISLIGFQTFPLGLAQIPTLVLKSKSKSKNKGDPFGRLTS